MRSILGIFFDFDSNPSLILSTIQIFSFHFSFISSGNIFNDLMMIFIPYVCIQLYTLHLQLVRDPRSNKIQCFSGDKV